MLKYSIVVILGLLLGTNLQGQASFTRSYSRCTYQNKADNTEHDYIRKWTWRFNVGSNKDVEFYQNGTLQETYKNVHNFGREFDGSKYYQRIKLLDQYGEFWHIAVYDDGDIIFISDDAQRVVVYQSKYRT